MEDSKKDKVRKGDHYCSRCDKFLRIWQTCKHNPTILKRDRIW